MKKIKIKPDSELSPELLEVARNGGTEGAFKGKYWNDHANGIYQCAVCGTELFSSDTKFDSGSGWPSFTDPVNREKIELKEDRAYGMSRVEVRCKTCGAHLGHVFNDGPEDKGGKRYCINSISLALEKKEVE